MLSFILFLVVYRTIPTSNHNLLCRLLHLLVLYIVLFLHQTTTVVDYKQHRSLLYIVLFLHQTTTWRAAILIFSMLYIVLFLHQTTTEHPELHFPLWLYIVLFLHQTTTPGARTATLSCCISYYSYIKPQHKQIVRFLGTVVYRTIPTSNHNLSRMFVDRFRCISYYSYIKPQLKN